MRRILLIDDDERLAAPLAAYFRRCEFELDAAVRGLVAGDKFDRAKAQALVTEKTAALNTGSPEVIAALGDFYDSLNATQQAKVRDFMDRGRRGWRRG